MYESFFDFSDRPFVAAPLVENYYPAESIEHARQTLIRIVERAEGPGIVVGQAGLGKSLLCRLLAEYFRDSFDVVVLSSARIGTRKSLLQSILFELRLPYLELEEGELRLGLLDFLQPGKSSRNGLLLIVDEAHSLPMRLLDEVRMITNLVREGQPRARLVMAGGPQLEERFAHPKLESFNQRLAARCYLDNFGREDTFRYVHSQIRAVGGNPQALFTESALEAVHRASDGIPRLINQICDHALVLGSAGGRRQLDQYGIEEAWADLQQLPGPWVEPATADGAADVIEFGELSDDLPGESPQPETREVAADHAADDIDGASGEYDLSTGMISMTPEQDDDLNFDPSQLEDRFADHSESPVEIGGQEFLVAAGIAEYESLSIDCFEGGAEDESPVDPPPACDAPNEVSSTDTCDPFGTEFDEEEVIIDRHTALAIEAFQGRPVVSSPEGQALGELLVPGDADPEARLSLATDKVPNLGTIETFDPELFRHADDDFQVHNESGPTIGHTLFQHGSEFTLGEEPDSPVGLVTKNDEEWDLDDGVAELTCVAFPDPEIADDDRELMIIRREELPPASAETAEAAGNSSTEQPDLVKRVEYQELFAQLRKA